MHLVLDTGGGVAEDALVEDGEDTAASTLANGGADLGEVVGIGGGVWGCREDESQYFLPA